MANTPNTTPTAGLKPLKSVLCEDRLAFREALDCIFKALRADWIVHEHRKNMNSAEGQERVHQSATAWCACIDALRAVLDINGANDDLKAAATAFLTVTDNDFLDMFDLMESGSVILKLHHRNKRTNPGLAALLYEAYALTDAYRGNLDLMAVHRLSD